MNEVEETVKQEWPNMPVYFVVRRGMGDGYSLETQGALGAKELAHTVEKSILLPKHYRPSLTQAISDYLAGTIPTQELPEAKDEDTEFLARLRRIIEGSDHEGERANAQSLYERIAGKPYTKEEPNA